MKFSSTVPLIGFALRASAQSWDNPDGGNTQAEIGDVKVNFGDTPPWYAFDKIKNKCPSNGCNSETEITYSTNIIQDGEMVGADIQLHVEGSFNDEGEPGNLNDLVELVKAVVAHSEYDFNAAVKYTVGSGCGTAGFTPCDPGDEYTADQYAATNLIVIRVEDDGGSQLADISVSISIEVDDVGSGVCKTILTVGTGMASAVNGVLAGIFVLAGLGCSA